MGHILDFISQCDSSSLSKCLLPKEDWDPIMRSTFEEEATNNILSFGQNGSRGRKASPHLSTERTAMIYSTEGGI